MDEETSNYEDGIVEDNEDIIEDNEDIIEDIESVDPSSLVIYSRDWTIETIYSQIQQGNIELNPKFQRRNAWNDSKRSKLIESIIIGYPIPEIVLAEDPSKKKAFIVIDGKQRLLTIAGFINSRQYEYWDKARLIELKVLKDLKGITYGDLTGNIIYSDQLREFHNSSLRCTVIGGFKDTGILYDIFYRLNSGSVPLSTQELRQVLNKGNFADFLVNSTNTFQPIHKVLKLKGPDKRLNDVEVLLRLISTLLFPETYSGNLKKFLDESMSKVTKEWSKYSTIVIHTYSTINNTIDTISEVFGSYDRVGRKTVKSVFEKRFNRVLFEVEIFYFSKLNKALINKESREAFIKQFEQLCDNPLFKASIETTTKSKENYLIRFSLFEKLINNTFNASLQVNPFK